MTPLLRSYLVLFALTLLIFLINMDYTAVNIALLPISKEFSSDLNRLQWLLSAYVLAWASVMIPAGQMSDIFGKRRMLLIGIVSFAMASILCGVAENDVLLIAARVLQGLGGALFVPPLYSIIMDLFPKTRVGFAIGILGVGAGLGLAVGPSFGGYLLENFGWRWIFLINAPLCLFVSILFVLFVKGDFKADRTQKVDVSGGISLASGSILLMYTLNQAEVWGLQDLRFWGLIGLSILSFGIFQVTSKNKANPLIPRGLFANNRYVCCILGFSAFQYAFSTVLVIYGLYLQNILGYSAYETGLMFLSMTLALGALSPLGGAMVDNLGARLPTCLGLLILAGALALSATFDVNSRTIVILITLFFIGLGMGLTFPAMNTYMMQVVDPKIVSTASGTFVMASLIANSIGVVLSTSLLTGLGKVFFDQKIHALQVVLSDDELSRLHNFLNAGYRDLSSLNVFDTDSTLRYVTMINESLSQSMTYVMIITSAVSLLTCCYCYIRLRPENQTSSSLFFNAKPYLCFATISAIVL